MHYGGSTVLHVYMYIVNKKMYDHDHVFYINVYEPLGWVRRVPMGSKGFLTFQPQFSRLGHLEWLRLLHKYIGMPEQALGWLPLDWDWL